MNYRSGGICCDDEEEEEETSLGKDMTRLAVLFAAAPFAVAANKLAGDPIRKKWAPREEELRKQFEEFKLDQRLAQPLTQ